MHQISEGSLYLPHRTSCPEGCKYNFYDGGHELKIYLPQSTPTEVEAIRHGRANF